MLKKYAFLIVFPFIWAGCTAIAPFYVRNLTKETVTIRLKKLKHAKPLQLVYCSSDQKLEASLLKKMKTPLTAVSRDSSTEIYQVPPHVTLALGDILGYRFGEVIQQVSIEQVGHPVKVLDLEFRSKEIQYHSSVWQAFRYFWYDIQ